MTQKEIHDPQPSYVSTPELNKIMLSTKSRGCFLCFLSKEPDISLKKCDVQSWDFLSFRHLHPKLVFSSLDLPIRIQCLALKKTIKRLYYLTILALHLLLQRLPEDPSSEFRQKKKGCVTKSLRLLELYFDNSESRPTIAHTFKSPRYPQVGWVLDYAFKRIASSGLNPVTTIRNVTLNGRITDSDIFGFLIGKKTPKEATSGLLFPHALLVLMPREQEFSSWIRLWHRQRGAWWDKRRKTVVIGFQTSMVVVDILQNTLTN